MQKIIQPKYLILILMLGIISPGCSLFHKSNRRKAEKKLEQKDEQGIKEYETGRKQHLKNQSRQTKKMMKNTKRRVDKINRGKKKNHSGKHCNITKTRFFVEMPYHKILQGNSNCII